MYIYIYLGDAGFLSSTIWEAAFISLTPSEQEMERRAREALANIGVSKAFPEKHREKRVPNKEPVYRVVSGVPERTPGFGRLQQPRRVRCA